MTAAATIAVPELVTRAALLAARVGGLMLIAPMYGARVIPMPVRTALVLLVAVVMLPLSRVAGSAVLLTPASVLGELLVGFVLGIGAALVVGAAETAGEYISLQVGLSGAALLDPLSHHQSSALGIFLQFASLTLLVSAGGHLLMLDALAASTERIPLGSALAVERGLAAVVADGGALFLLGLQLAAPVMAALLVSNVALAVLSRAAPQLNVLQIAFPVQILVGLVTLALVVPVLATRLLGWEALYGGVVTRAFDALVETGAR